MDEQAEATVSDLNPAELQRLESAYDALALKDEPRRGWVQHGVAAPETVAAHSWGTAFLCLLFADAAGVDRDHAVAIAVLHDLAEAETGDIAARLHHADREVSESAKRRLEERAMTRLLPGGLAELHAMWKEYETRANPAARFVREMNLIDMCLQALRYERLRRYDANVVVASAGGHRHLDEFFLGARAKLETPLAKRLMDEIHTRYQRDKQPLDESTAAADLPLG